MIETGAIKEIEALTKKGMETREVEGLSYLPEGFTMVKRPLADTLKVATLQAIVDYINNGVDGVATESMLIQVLGPDQVKLCRHLFEKTRQREVLVYANLPHELFAFGSWQQQEQFIIGLQSMFVQDETVDELLKLAGSITDEAVKTSDDDGITQRVTAKVGIQRVENVAVKGRFTLKPHRTFMEVEQPASEFIFRIKSGAAQGPVAFALFEADSGAWKLEAISKVASWIQAETSEDITIMA